MLTIAGGEDRRVHWLFAVTLAVAAIMRLPALGTVPPPLNQDEASRGYDAWAILETGADRHGQHWPLFLESFGPGDFTAALSTYITVPFIAVLGPTAVAMRLPDAVLGVLTVGVLYWWLKRQAGSTVALLAAAVLALDPWHIMLCRTAHESGFAPFFLAMAMLALHRCGVLADGVTDESDPPRVCGAWALLAGIMLGFHTWNYPATRFFTPLFCVAIVVIYRRRLMAVLRDRSMRLVLLAFGVGLIGGLLPLIITATLHPERLAARAAVTLLIHKGLSVGPLVWAFVHNYAANIDPRYLFLQCDEMSSIVIPHVGQHLPVLAPLFIIGVIRVVGGWRREPWCCLLIVWLLLYPIPAAICADWNPHPMRTVSGMILFPILTALGGEWVVHQMAGRRVGFQRLAIIATAVVIAANFAHFANSYYREFRRLGRAGYQTAMVEAMRFAAKAEHDADFILVTNYSNQPYIYALLYQPIDPKSLAHTGIVSAEGRLGFHQILRIGRYYFFPSGPEAVRRFEEEWSRLPAGTRGLLIDIQRADRPAPGEVLARFPVGDPRSAGQVLEVCRFQKVQESPR
jgi:4-amino-4-deoxy-L-arabinose transferase-like glycosyltransferase